MMTSAVVLDPMGELAGDVVDPLVRFAALGPHNAPTALDVPAGPEVGL